MRTSKEGGWFWVRGLVKWLGSVEWVVWRVMEGWFRNRRKGGDGIRGFTYVAGHHLRGDGARIEALLVDVGVLVGDTWPLELGADHAMAPGVEVEPLDGVIV
jgi:hypothetical protein